MKIKYIIFLLCLSKSLQSQNKVGNSMSGLLISQFLDSQLNIPLHANISHIDSILLDYEKKVCKDFTGKVRLKSKLIKKVDSINIEYFQGKILSFEIPSIKLNVKMFYNDNQLIKMETNENKYVIFERDKQNRIVSAKSRIERFLDDSLIIVDVKKEYKMGEIIETWALENLDWEPLVVKEYYSFSDEVNKRMILANGDTLYNQLFYPKLGIKYIKTQISENIVVNYPSNNNAKRKLNIDRVNGLISTYYQKSDTLSVNGFAFISKMQNCIESERVEIWDDCRLIRTFNINQDKGEEILEELTLIN